METCTQRGGQQIQKKKYDDPREKQSHTLTEKKTPTRTITA